MGRAKANATPKSRGVLSGALAPRSEADLDAAMVEAMSDRDIGPGTWPVASSAILSTDQMVAAIADQLCGIVKDDYDIRVSVETDVDNTNIQKLTLLINALLENVRRNIGSLSELANALETKVRERTLKLDLIVQGSNDGVWIWDLTNGATEYSPRWRQLLGLESEGLDHIEDWLARVHPDDIQRLRAALSAHLQGTTQFVHEDYRIRHSDGTYRWMWCRGKCHRNDVGRAVLMAGTQTDVHGLRSIDAATGLQNELTLVTNMEALIRGGIPFRAMVIGLPRVVTMKEELNTAEIEALRASIAERLAASLPFGVDLARLTGDYYAAVVPCDRAGPCDGAPVADALHRAFDRPFTVSGRTIWLDLSIGATMRITQTTAVPSDVMRDAWTSYRCARTDGKRFNVLSDAQVVAARDRAMMEQQIRMALDNDWFVPFFQPIVDIRSGQTAGFEVLARMEHPKLGLIPPSRFIPVADAIGVIGDVSMVMLRRAVDVLSVWGRGGTRMSRLFLSVNLEAAQIMHETFVQTLGDLLRTNGVNPGNLKLEIVESSVIGNFAAAARQMARLRKLGVKIALDDFGTGYSSLEYLNQLDFDLIKIDKTFMDNIETDVRKKSMVRMMCVLADLLGAEVCVEGIEHEGQAEIARGLKVSLGQGYLYSRPLPLDRALEHASSL
jgi:PAS domain S-box-containing protein